MTCSDFEKNIPFGFYGLKTVARGGHIGFFSPILPIKSEQNIFSKSPHVIDGGSLEEHACQVSGLYLENSGRSRDLKVILSYRELKFVHL